MARLKAQREKTIKALFAKSGNQCAFPKCEEQLIDDKYICIGELCHIEAVNKNWPRFNPNSNDEYRRSYKNLILLCPTHHRKIDKSNKISKEDLKEMKINHETRFELSSFLQFPGISFISQKITAKSQRETTQKSLHFLKALFLYLYAGLSHNIHITPDKGKKNFQK